MEKFPKELLDNLRMNSKRECWKDPGGILKETSEKLPVVTLGCILLEAPVQVSEVEFLNLLKI